MKRLMIQVERTVRPVRAEESTKCKMREELHAHITAIHDEELARADDQRTAIERTLRRFGEPVQLTAELQASVSPIERLVAAVDRSVQRRKDESMVRHALRMAIRWACCYAALVAVVLLAIELLVVTDAMPRPGRVAANFSLTTWFVGVFGVWLSVQFGVFTLIGYGMRSQMEDGLLRPRSFRVAGGLCLLAMITVFASGWGLTFAMAGEPVASFELLVRWSLLAGLTPLALVVVSRLAAIEVVRSRPWTSLDIAD